WRLRRYLVTNPVIIVQPSTFQHTKVRVLSKHWRIRSLRHRRLIGLVGSELLYFILNIVIVAHAWHDTIR
ncbi:hypothetical protein H8356DRAFT_1430190, partial [Neocallimastix lanati (nom. inval.)]